MGYLIAGGGVMRKEDIEAYKNIGADGVSLGAVCFHPFKLYNILK